MRYHFLLILFLCSAFAAEAQFSATDKKQRAKEFIYHEKYSRALALLSASRELSRDDREGRFLIGICQYHLNQLEAAKNTLTKLVEEERSPYPECWLYLARTYHARHQFEEAGHHYKLYLRTLRRESDRRQMVIEEIRRCANGISLQFQMGKAVVENLGQGVNTEYDEFAPVVSPNFDHKIYFSSARYGNNGGPRNSAGKADDQLGHYYSDIFSTELVNGAWRTAIPMHYLLNSPSHEVLLGFNADGQVLYYFKGSSPDRGEILVDTFRQMGNRTLSTTPLAGPMNPAAGDGNPFFYSDTLLIFSSRRPGGFGGLDLYKSALRNGRWTTPANLGETINTPYDETTPFLARDGHTLYFSSNDSYKSMGGLDVFKAFFVEKTQTWTRPVNLGTPVNSASDDSHFRLVRDGFTGYFASARKDGLGQRDIYVAYFQEFLEEMEEPPTRVAYRPPLIDEPKPSPSLQNDFAAEPYQPVGEAPVQISAQADFDDPPLRPAPEIPTVLVNEDPISILDRIQEKLRENPQLTIVITAYGNPALPASVSLYQAIQEAEKAAYELVGRGINPQLIFMRAIQRQEMEEGKTGLAFTFADLYSSQVMSGSFSMADEEQSKGTASSGSGLLYKVQILSSQGALRESALAGQVDAMVEKKIDFAFYRYTSGAFDNYAGAEQFRKNMVREGKSGAYVVPYAYGVRIEKNDARRLAGVFPDLENYLRR